MSKRNAALIIGLLLFTLPVSAAVKSRSDDFFTNFPDTEKCSSEIEQLKLCIDSAKLTIESGNEAVLKVRWINSGNFERRFRGRPFDCRITIKNEKGETLTQVLQKKIQDGSAASEDLARWIRLHSGSSRGMLIGANQTLAGEIQLVRWYDYDLTARGIYFVTISKTLPGLESEKTIEFVIDGIEIEVK